MRRFMIASVLIAGVAPALAQQVGTADFTFADGILVTSADVPNCPYRLVQPISVNVTEDYGADSRGKIFDKFREKAKKLNADAVVLVVKGGRHMTAWAFSRREYTGNAIRYVDRACGPTSL